MTNNKIINVERSIIIACDVDLKEYEQLVKETCQIEKIGGYKVGFYLGLKYGLPTVVQIARKYTDKPIIYDHQKACTDIPDTGEKFVKVCKDSGIDAVIFMAQSGPATLKAWIKAAQDQKIKVIVGGLMTHSQYKRSEGGFISDEAVYEIYDIAASLGVQDYVVPGNKPEEISKIKKIIESKKIIPIFYAPGFLSQKGDISEAGKAAGKKWHAIVGRGIYEAKDVRKAALELSNKI